MVKRFTLVPNGEAHCIRTLIPLISSFIRYFYQRYASYDRSACAYGRKHEAPEDSGLHREPWTVITCVSYPESRETFFPQSNQLALTWRIRSASARRSRNLRGLTFFWSRNCKASSSSPVVIIAIYSVTEFRCIADLNSNYKTHARALYAFRIEFGYNVQ